MSFYLNKNPNSGGGGSGGTPTTVVNTVTSTSTSSALSANMGRVLNETILAHEKLIASETVLGHVKVDGTTITINNQTGVISSTGGSSSSSIVHQQGVIPTTIIDQETWMIPYIDFDYPTDLLIVSQNTGLLSPTDYTITKNTNGTNWDLNIPNTSGIPIPIDKNQVYIIIIKSGGSGGGGGGSSFPQPAMKQFIAETIIDPIGGFHYKIASYIPEPTDKFEVNFNTTTLNDTMYTLSDDGIDTYIKLSVLESPIQSKNTIAGTIYRNFNTF